jgi:hypothetical protein
VRLRAGDVVPADVALAVRPVADAVGVPVAVGAGAGLAIVVGVIVACLCMKRKTVYVATVHGALGYTA